MHRTVPFPTLAKSYSAQNVNGAEVENPCCRVNNIKLLIAFAKCLILYAALWTDKINQNALFKIAICVRKINQYTENNKKITHYKPNRLNE